LGKSFATYTPDPLPLIREGGMEVREGLRLSGNPPESPFTKGGELLPFLKGEQEELKQGD